MAARTPLVVVLAGPNGASKSTSAARLLRGALAVDEFVKADTIAQGLSAYRPKAAAVAAWMNAVIADPVAWESLKEKHR